MNDIWSRVINNYEAFWDKKKSDKQLSIILSDSEKMDLYEILSKDNGKVLDSFLKAEHNQP